MDQESLNLNKYISDTGICSRREAEKFIVAGRVKINGTVAVLGNRVREGDEVLLDNKPVKAKQRPLYIAFNKPVGITCTTERHIKGNIIDYIKHPQRIFPIGRLDKPSEGLIFLTTDGNIVNKILRAGNNHEKEYTVAVNKPITEDFIRKMGNGVPILDQITKKCHVEKISNFVFKIILTQGLNRQIRRMCEHLGYSVTSLRRDRIMNVSLEGIGVGKWRYLADSEIKEIEKAVAESVKTEEASLAPSGPRPRIPKRK
jgi:23S rRNA pseudouridine2604 synthase